MPKCTYCEKTYENPRGITVVNSATGSARHYCSSKCRKNAEMRRKKRKWAKPRKGEKVVIEEEEEKVEIAEEEEKEKTKADEKPAKEGKKQEGKK